MARNIQKQLRICIQLAHDVARALKAKNIEEGLCLWGLDVFFISNPQFLTM